MSNELAARVMAACLYEWNYRPLRILPIAAKLEGVKTCPFRI